MRALSTKGVSHPGLRPRGRAVRWLFHLTLLAAFFALGGALLVWPQWIALDGSRTALEIQQSRERELTERLEAVRQLNQRLREWQQSGRRVFLTEEVREYPAMVRALAAREGAVVLQAVVTDRPSPRWRSLAIHGGDWDTGMAEPGAEIRPRVVKVVVAGSFDSVFRAVAALSQHQRLFVPDRWDLVPRAGTGAGERALKAEIWGTVFTVREPGGEARPAAAPGPVARAVLPGGVE